MIAALICAADSLDDAKKRLLFFVERYADWIEHNLEAWTVTRKGLWFHVSPIISCGLFRSNLVILCQTAMPIMPFLAYQSSRLECRCLSGQRGCRCRLSRTCPIRDSPSDDPIILNSLILLCHK